MKFFVSSILCIIINRVYGCHSDSSKHSFGITFVNNIAIYETVVFVMDDIGVS